MQHLVGSAQDSEAQFADFVASLTCVPVQHQSLLDLLQENHPFYDQRSTAAVVRMRGWVLLAIARAGVSEHALPFVLEELDLGTDAYLVGAAARALRMYHQPKAALTPFVVRALTNVRDEPLSFEGYGEYATGSTETTAVRELLATLVWLGAHARSALPMLGALRAQPGKFSTKALADLDETVKAIQHGRPIDEDPTDTCCILPARLSQKSWNRHERPGSHSIDSIVFEDQDGATVRFREFFKDNPSIVVFFYTRCDNPWKCSLTVTKLAHVQQMLKQRGIFDKIQTGAITYDPAFDLPKRLRGYGYDRGVSFDPHHRMLRTTEGFAAVRSHFQLGVNFIESLVNRHRIEVYILDRAGRITASFERLLWDETVVVDRAIEVLSKTPSASLDAKTSSNNQQAAAGIVGLLASFLWALFPKCPSCWAAYLSAFGLAGIAKILDVTKLKAVLVALILLNVASVWHRTRSARHRIGFYLVCAGSLAMIVARMVVGWENFAIAGAALVLVGSLVSVISKPDPQTRLAWSQIVTNTRRRLQITSQYVREVFQPLEVREKNSNNIFPHQ